MARELLTVWALAPATPPKGPYGDLGTFQKFTVHFDPNAGFSVKDAAGTRQDWYEDLRSGTDKALHQSITLLGVRHVEFHAAGWPDGAIPDLELKTVPQVPPRHSLIVERMPFEADKDQDIRAYQRLLQTCAIDGSFVRITKDSYLEHPGTWVQTGQWLSFRLPLLPSSLVAAPSGSGSMQSGALDWERVVAAGLAGLPPPLPRDYFEGLAKSAAVAAELREADTKRISFLAGGLRWDKSLSLGTFESMAVNATSPTVLGATHVALGGTGKYTPSLPGRWGMVGGLHDGFWWALNKSGLDPSKLTLDGALSKLPCFPQSPTNATGEPILTLLGQTNVSERAQLAALDLLGLRAAAVVPTPPADLPACNGGKTPPYHYLHMRKLAQNALEWRRWIAVECPGDPSKASPVLLRVTRPTVAAERDSPLTVRLEGLSDAHLLAIWSAKIALDFRERALRDGATRGVTLIPDLIGAWDAKDQDAGGHWVAELACVEPWNSSAASSALGCRIKTVSIFRSDDSAAPAKAGKFDYLASAPCSPAGGSASLSATALDFKSLSTQDPYPDATLRFEGVIAVGLDQSRLDFSVDAHGTWSPVTAHSLTVESQLIEVSPSASPAAHVVAIGGLDIVFGKGALPAFALRIDPRRPGDHWLGEDGDAALRLPVAQVDIGGADTLDHDLSRQPLMWGSARALMRSGTLVGRDRRLEVNGRRSIDFDLRPESAAIRGNVGRAEITSIDPSPMLISLVSIERLTAPTDTEASVCTWSSDDARWRVVRVQNKPSEIAIAMPPQGTADAWERASGGSTYLGPDQIAEGERVPARLTSTTIFRVEGDERDRNPIGPWNLRNLLGASDADLPGARMTTLDRFEVLYGLEANAEHLSGLRIAELAGWRGEPREPIAASLKDTTSLHALRAREWHTAIDVWKGRLATLDLREERDTSVKPIIDNVRYTVRKPQAKAKGLGRPHYAKPKGVDPDFDEWWTDVADGGILGGVLAGFERKEIIQNLLKKPVGEGRIEGFQLSSLGATTKLHAEFDNGLTLVSADVTMGWVNEARFERKGRIAAFHHLAKHVIVYRRVFVPSRQFADEQDWHVGRPIMRKVEEYIELTQAVRNYPDRAGATELNSGAMKGARFRSTRIPIHGSWASALVDPRVEGYSIPLWREGVDAAIYPRPDAEMLLAAAQLDPSEIPDPIARRIETPQRLAFYTLTSIIGDNGASSPPGDVEMWPLVYKKDFVDRPQDNPAARPIPDEAYGLSDAANPLPPIAIEAPGFEDYTLLLEAGPPVNVMQGRSAKSMVADLRSILALRAQSRAVTKELPADALRYSNITAGRAHISVLAKLTQNADITATELRNAAKEEFSKLTDTLTWKQPGTNPSTALNLDGLCGWAHEPAERFKKLIKQLEDVPLDDTHWELSRATVLRQLRQVQSAIDSVLPFDATFRMLYAPLVDKANMTREDIKIRLQNGASTLGADLAKQVDAWLAALEKPVDQARQLEQDIQAGLVDASQALDRIQREVADAVRQLTVSRDTALAFLPKLDAFATSLRKAADQIAKPAPRAAALATTIAGKINAIRSDLTRRLPEVEAQLQAYLSKASELVSQWKADALKGGAEAAKILRQIEDYFLDARTAARDQVRAAAKLLKGIVSEIDATLAKEIQDADSEISKLPQILNFEQPIRETSEKISFLIRLAADARTPSTLLQDLNAQRTAIVSVATGVQRQLEDTAGTLCGFFTGADKIATDLLADWNGQISTLKAELDALGQDIDAIRARIDAIIGGADIALAQLKAGVEDILDGKLIDDLTSSEVEPQGVDQAVALSLLRAAGAPPIVEQLVFNRDQIAYHFDEKMRVIVTPVTALVDQLNQGLKGVGVTLPTLGIDDQLLAPAHAVFDDLRTSAQSALDDMKLKAKDVLKDFAGLKDLLPNLKFDSKLARGIKVTHDYDSARRVVWLQAEISYGPETQDLFSHDAFAIIAEDMTLNGVSRYERGISGGETRTVKASLTSNWRLVIGGIPLVRIRDAVVRYDQSEGLKFDIDPQKIEFPGAMQMLTKLLASLNNAEKPLAIEMLLDEASGRPIGLRSRYDLPPTAFSAGAFAVFNAALGIHLDLAQRSEFEIRSFAYFGRRESPFALTVSFLGGGGYLEAEAIHRPRSRSTDLAVRVSIGAVAGTGFSFGPMRGSIQVYLGMEATFFSGTSGSRMSLSAVIVLSGSVTVWGFVTVDLGVRLAITYNGSSMQGHGDIHVSVRISRFYKKEFERAIAYSI